MINTAPKIIKLSKILDERGNLSVIEENKDIPFKIKRSYLIYDVPGGEERGGHAYKDNQEFIIALSGSFDVIVDNGKKVESYSLKRSYYGLYIPRLHWRTLNNFSTNSIALIVASTEYEASDYIRNYEKFKSSK